jgi:hypothetical protein
LAGCYGSSVYLAWSFLGPSVYQRCTSGCFSAGPGIARQWSGNRCSFTHCVGLEDRGRLGLVRGHGSGPCRGEPAGGGPGPRRAGGLPARCARAGALPGGRAVARGGGSTGTAKASQPTGTGSPVTGRPAPARLVCGGTACCWRGGPLAGCPGRGQGTVSENGRPFRRVREPVTLPHRQLICLLIRVPADSGAPFLWRTHWTRRE